MDSNKIKNIEKVLMPSYGYTLITYILFAIISENIDIFNQSIIIASTLIAIIIFLSLIEVIDKNESGDKKKHKIKVVLLTIMWEIIFFCFMAVNIWVLKKMFFH